MKRRRNVFLNWLALRRSRLSKGSSTTAPRDCSSPVSIDYLPDLQWDGEGCSTSGATSSYSERFVDSLNDNFLYQHVSCPTFYDSTGCPGNCLDLVITDRADRVTSVASLGMLGGAKQGHLLLQWDYRVSGKSSQAEITFTSSLLALRKGDYEKMSTAIDKIGAPS